MSLPANAQYYFNIVVVTILVSQETMNELFDIDLETYWSIENINEPRPYIVGIIKLNEEELQDLNEEFGTEVTYTMEVYPHCVVEVDQQLGVSWFPMFDDEQELDPWSL